MAICFLEICILHRKASSFLKFKKYLHTEASNYHNQYFLLSSDPGWIKNHKILKVTQVFFNLTNARYSTCVEAAVEKYRLWVYIDHLPSS